MAEGAAKNDLFLSALHTEKADILEAVAELKEYRTQVLAELVQETKQSVEELTDKVYVGVQNKIDSANLEMGQSGSKWLGFNCLGLIGLVVILLIAIRVLIFIGDV